MRQTTRVTEKGARRDFERAGGEHERREWKWRRDEVQRGERDGPALAHPGAHPLEPSTRHPTIETLLANLAAHPERQRGAGDRAGGGQQWDDQPPLA